MEDKKLKKLINLAWRLRKEVLMMLYEAGSGHTASSLGLAEFMVTMYGSVLRYDVERPNWMGRDRLIVSNGHVVPIWYAVLAEFDFFPKKELKALRKLGSRLQGHPHTIYSDGRPACLPAQASAGRRVTGDGLVPGIENTGGPLGQGVSVAVGRALGLKLKERELKSRLGYLPRVFCLLSDAELQEGQVWEAFQLAVKQKLNNLVFIIDRNNIQIDAYVNEVTQIEPLSAKLEAFGFEVREVDGNKVEDLVELFEDRRLFEQPSGVIMKTVAGKGVSFMENKWEWHGKVPNKEELERALEEITKHSPTHPQFSSAHSYLAVSQRQRRRCAL